MDAYTLQQQQQLEQQAYEHQQYEQQLYEQQQMEQQQYLQQQYDMQQQQVGFGLQVPQLGLLQPQAFQFQPAPAFNFGFPMNEVGAAEQQQQPLLQLPQTNSFVAANSIQQYPFVFYPEMPETEQASEPVAAGSPAIAKKTRDANVKKGKKKAKGAMCNCFAS